MLAGCIIFRRRHQSVFKMGVSVFIAWTLAGARAEADDTSIRFVVKPKLCVLSVEEESCQDTLEILWRAQSLKSVCLFQNTKTLPLRCWENETGGRHAVDIKTGQDIEFQLREIKDKQLLVSRSFEVIHDKQEFRRKKRNPWSFF